MHFTVFKRQTSDRQLSYYASLLTRAFSSDRKITKQSPKLISFFCCGQIFRWLKSMPIVIRLFKKCCCPEGPSKWMLYLILSKNNRASVTTKTRSVKFLLKFYTRFRFYDTKYSIYFNMNVYLNTLYNPLQLSGIALRRSDFPIGHIQFP